MCNKLKFRVGNVIVNKKSGEEATVFRIDQPTIVKGKDSVTLQLIESFDGWDLKLCDNAELGFCDYEVKGDGDGYTALFACHYCQLYRQEMELRKGDKLVGTIRLDGQKVLSGETDEKVK